MIEKIPFGGTGHSSTRILFGAAALSRMRQDKADETLEIMMEYGVNHIDCAASYGEAELRLAPFLQDHRDDVFLATKTGDRTRDAAMASIERSLERMGVDQIDLIQFHNLSKEQEWESAMSPGGCLEAAIAAKEQGMVRFIGVTGHGTRVAEMHLKSLDHFEFDSVLCPYSYTSMQDPQYAEEFETLYQTCKERGVAMQTIKSIARRRWRDDDPSKRFSWYEPVRETKTIRHAVHWILRRPGLFLNSSSDVNLLRVILDAAVEAANGIDDDIEAKVEQDARSYEMEPLFERGVLDDVRP